MILVKYMWELELCAEKKIMWEAAHPEVFGGLSKVKNCKSALAMAKMNMPFCKLIYIDYEQSKIKSTATKSVKVATYTTKYPKRW
jgi:hypothetical protein